MVANYHFKCAFLFVFYLLIDRQRIIFILLVFFISFVLVGTVDELGKFFGVWSYPHQLLVFTHRFNSVDFAVIPVILTLVYQFFSKWKFYWIASLIASAFIAFIGVPIFTFFHILWSILIADTKKAHLKRSA